MSRRAVTLGVAVSVGVLLVGTVVAYLLLEPLRDTEREDFDPSRGRGALPAEQPEWPDGPAHDDRPDVGPPADDADGPDVPDDTDSGPGLAGAFESVLVLGSDAQGIEGGGVADAIMVGLLPADGSDPVLFSIPRDLWIPDPCHGGMTRINAGLQGCDGRISGPELMAIMVEDLTSLPIDHYVKVHFDGFTGVIDAIGGVEICNDRPVRDWRAELELPAGCVEAGGDDTLAWVRSRRTEQQVGGTWRAKPGVNDLTRNERQQEVALQTLERLSSFRSVGQLRALTKGIADSVTISDSLSATRAARIAWALRGLEREDVRVVRIPVEDHVTSGGAQVLVPVESFERTFLRAVPDGEDLLARD
jgi:LCP family protein required for cell wall assembly